MPTESFVCPKAVRFIRSFTEQILVPTVVNRVGFGGATEGAPFSLLRASGSSEFAQALFYVSSPKYSQWGSSPEKDGT